MDAEDNQSRLMLVLIDWQAGARESNFYRQELLEADWRSSAEFQGYLVRILEGGVTREAALKGWYNPAEKSWVYYISGLAAHRRGNTEEAINLLQEAALSSDPDAWESILSRAMIEDLRKEQRKVFATDDQWEKYAAQVERFEAVMRETVEIKKKRQAELAPLWARLADGMMPLEDRRAILEKAHEIDPENLTTLATLAYCTSALGAWSDALDCLRRFLKAEGRLNAVQMSLGLLEAGILHYEGQESEAQQKLSDLSRRMRDPWFLSICEYLLGRQTEEFLRKQAAERPEDIITAYTMMGFWAEGSKDSEKALRFYKEALGTFLAEWLQYDFARERITRLKQAKY